MIVDRIPLSFSQTRLWFLHRLYGASALYNIPAALRIEGALDIGALRRALDDVVARHEALRTIFPDNDGTPSAEIVATASVPWSIDAVDEETLPDRLADAAATPFDLTRDLPVRAWLFRLDAERHVLLLLLHHIAADGWSAGVLLRDLATALAARMRGEAPPFPELELQYSDYTLWQREHLGDESDPSSVAAEQLRFWQRALADLPEELSLPADHPRPAVATGRGTTVPLRFEPAIHRALLQLARDANASLFMVLHAALAAFLQRVGAGDDILIGTAVAGRDDHALDDVVGLFINSLTLRTNLSGRPTFRELLARVRAADLDALENQDLPFERIVDALQPTRSLSRHPLFQVMLLLQNVPDAPLSVPGLSIRREPLRADFAKLDLTFELFESESLEGRAEFSLDRFDRATAETLTARFQRFLHAVASDPDLPLWEQPILLEDERRLLAEVNATARPLEETTVIDLFERRAAEHPGDVAVVFGETTLTYGELDARADRLADRLAAMGAGAETIVAISFERSIELVVAIVAVLKTGAAYLPLDPEHPDARRAQILDDARPHVVLSEADDLAGGHRPERALHPHQLAYVIYTSGSTGTPKGAPNTHGGLLNRILWMQDAYRLDATDAVLQKTPYTFDVSVWEFLWPLVRGARLVVAEPRRQGDAVYLAETIARHGVTTLHFVPSMLRAFLDHAPLERCASLRRVICSGEALPAEVQALFFARLPHVELHNLYGPTEAAIDVTAWPCRAPGTPPIGHPIWNTRAYVLDGALEPVPVGVAGELYLAGAGLARGYLNRPALTAERFVADPFAGGARMYRTGDLARRRPDGALDFLGRSDQQVKIRGFRIELGEIEAVLAAQPGVAQCAVVARAQQLVAYVVPRTADVAALRASLAERLPDYMVPAAWVALEAMPLSPNGKLDRKALPAPERHAGAGREPRNEAEAALCAIVAGLLGLDRAGVADNFFALGGDSILSIQLVSRARKAGLALTPAEVFQRQTIEAMAAIARPVSAPAAIASDDGIGELTPTPIMRWLLDRGGAIAPFSQAMIAAVPDEISTAALTSALQSLIDTHDTLRMRLDRGSLRIGARGSVAASDVIEARPMAGVAAALEEAESGLDPEAGRVIRAVRLRRGRLLLVVHHLAVDAVSWPILLADLAAACDGSALAPVPVPFRAWASRLAEEARREETVAELPFWEGVLERGRPLLPDAALDPERDTFGAAGRLRFTVALGNVPQMFHARADEVLLAALAHAADTPLLVDVEGHGRDSEELDLSRTVGWFTTLYPVALDGRGGAVAAMKRVKEQLRAVPRRGRGFGLLRYLNPDTAPRLAHAAAQIGFNYLGRFSAGAADVDVTRTPYPAVPLAHLLEIDVVATGNTLTATWTWSQEHFTEDAMRALAARWRQSLDELRAGAGGHTPSDFDLVALTQDDVEQLEAAVPDLIDILPLSPLQEGLRFHAMYDSAPDAYVVQLAFRFASPLDAARLRAAAEAMLRRHPNLGASFRDRGDRPLQIVRKNVIPPWSEIDGVDDEAAWLAADRAERFDLAAGPSLRFALLDQRLLVFTCHHIVMDGWSMSVFFGELFALYRGEALPPAPPYADYLRWLRGQNRDAALAAWRIYLDGVEGPTLLARPRAGDALPPQRWEAELPAGATAALSRMARERGLTLGTVFQGLWAVLLARLTGSDDVTFGITVSGRPPELDGVEHMIGLFINTVPLRARVRRDQTLAQLLAAIQESQSALLAHQHVGLGEIQQAAGLGELFDTLLVVENYPIDENVFGGDLAGVEGHDATHYALSAMLVPGERLHARFDFDPLRFTSAEVESIAARFLRLLAAAPAQADAPVNALQIVDAAERQRLLHDANPARSSAAAELPFPRLFELQAERTPDAVAVAAGAASLSYRDLNERANALARRLVAAGAAPETSVGIFIERSVEMMVAVIATLKAGAAYLPLDPDYPAQRLELMIADAAPLLVLTTRALADRLPPRVPSIAVDDAVERGARDLDDADRRAPLLPQHPAYIIYTSGSTGTPKGVVVPHRGLANYLTWAAAEYRVAEGAGAVVHSSLAFDLTITGLFTPLLSGRAAYLIDDRGVDALGAAAAALPDLSLIKITPAHLEILAHSAPDRGIARCFVIGGEALFDEHLAHWRRHAPGTRLINEYGPTETVVGCCVYDATAESGGAIVPIGKPIANARLYILDSGLDPVPDGAVGELYIGGPGVARGYLGRPALTASRFVADPYAGEPGARIYRSGDLARRRADGEIEYLGRADEQVKIRGFRVEPGEVEALLAAQPGVVQCAVVARAQQLVAYVAGDCDLDRARDELAARLPAYMLPAAWVRLDRLPLNANGKIDRKALPAPERKSSGRAAATAEEAALCAIFAEVLSLDSVGADDDFFDLGGHSLLATRAVSRIRARLGRDVAIRTLFEAPTAAALAKCLGDEAAPPALTRRPRPEKVPLSYAQQRLWFLLQLEGASATYNTAAALRLRGALDAEALEQAIGDVVERHESLRTIFPDDAGVPYQHIVEARPPLARFALDDAAFAAEQTRAIDPRCELPLRASLFRAGEREHVLLLVIHHIAADGWSIAPLMRDLAAAYEARCAGGAPQFPPLPVQYADYALWQREILGDESDAGSRMARQLAFWRQALDGAPPELELPRDRKRGAAATNRGGWVPLRVDKALLDRLRALARESGATLFMLLHAALAALLGKLGAGTDIPIGTGLAGRRDRALEELIGFFVNTLALRADVSGDPSFRELLDRVKRFDLAAYEQQDVPFERVVETLQPARSLSRLPLFQVMLAVQNIPEPLLRMGSLEVTPEPAALSAAKFDLYFELAEMPEGTLDGAVEYNEDLFERATAERIAAQFVTLLESAAAAPDAPLHTLPIGGAVVARGVAAPLPEATLAELFERQAALRPDDAAVVCGDTTLTYAALDRKANGIAHDLRARGVDGGVVALRMERGPDLIAALIGIVKAGAAYLPLDLAYPPERTRFMLDDSNARIVLTDIANIPETSCPPSPVPCDLTYVMYSSGSTGVPKGIAIPQDAVKRLVLDTDYVDLRPGDRIAQASNSSFDAATFEIWGALLNGATLVILPRETTLSPTALAAALREQRIDTLFLTTALFNQIAREVPDAFSGLRDLLFGGELVDAQWVRRVLERGAPRRLLHVYGPTENTTFSTWHLVEQVPSDAPTVPIGRPITNTDCAILDSWIDPVPPGVAGDLYVSGPGLALGYIARPALTAERFVADPFGNGTRMYRTGDLARWNAAGAIEFLGRADDQVKLRGFRIELGEIEAALRAHPDVDDAGVMLREDAPGVRQLAAYVVGSAPERELRAWLAERLPDYMVPAFLVSLEHLPLNANGKLDRAALPAPPRAGAGAAQPRTREEEILCGIVAEVLHLTGVGIDDNFFELGGDSIQSIQIVSRARSAGIDITARDIFQKQTVEALAAAARRTGNAIVEDGVGEVPPTPIAKWFLDRPGPKKTFSQWAELEVPAELTEAQLLAALQALIDTHDALRMRLDGGRLVVRERGAVNAAECLAPTREEAEGALDPEGGAMLRAVWRRGRLLAGIHHLGVDGVSWRILGADLTAACEAVLRGELPRLERVPTPLRAWGRFLAGQARAAVDELPRWESLLAGGGEWLPGVRLDDADTFATAEHFAQTLPSDWTAALLPKRIHEVLLAALAIAAGRPLVVNVEGHGREPGDSGLDLTRTVGWFTSIVPVALDAGGGSVGEQLRRVKEQLRAIPGAGLGYGLLRHLNDDTRERMAALGDAQVGFNYLGRFDDRGGEVLGGGGDEAMPLVHLLELNAMTLDGPGGPRLVAHWMWARRHCSEAQVRALAQRWEAALGALVHATRSQLEALQQRYGAIDDVLPLTALQEGLLFHALGSDDVYSVQLGVELSGPLDAARLRRAAEAMLQRHANLRAAFWQEAGERPLQIIPRHVALPWRETAARDDAELDALLAEDLAERFDVARAPLLRFALIRLDAERHLLLFTNHHILMDGWSMPLFFDELLALYRGDELPRATPYRDYLAWLERQDASAALAKWREALDGVDEGTRIAAERRGPRDGRRRERALGAELSRGIERAARDADVTVNTVIQAAWGLLLGCLTGRTDVLFGITVSGRPPELPGVERMVGLFINTVPLRVRLHPAKRFADLLAELQAEQSALLPYQHAALGSIQKDAGIGELFDTLVGFQNYPVRRTESPDDALRVTGFFGRDDTHYPLSLMVTPDERFALRFYFDSGIDINAIETRFVRLLEEIARDAARPLHLLGEEPLDEWSDTARDIEPLSLPALFEAHVARDPDAIAILTSDGERLTYGELNARANAVAHRLAAAGAGPETVVGIAMERSVDMVVAVLAAMKSGAAYLPLDPNDPEARRAQIIADSKPIAIVSEAKDLRGGHRLTSSVSPHNLAYLIYTSGSTGTPKAVAGTHAGVASLAAAQRECLGVTPRSRVLQFASLSFDASFWEFVMAFANGAALVLPRAEERTGPALADVIRNCGVTHATLPPAVLTTIDDPGSVPLQTLVVAGEACPPSTVAAWSKGRTMINAYGPTETTVCATMSAPLSGGDVAIGTPLLNTRVHVLDAALRPVPRGVAGELYVAGPSLARGYRGRPALTAERFVADPYAAEPGARMYRTGDLVRRRSDGQLEFLGRADQQVKLRGFRIEPREIEAALLRHDGVAQAAVIVREQRLLAYVVARSAVDEGACLLALREQLPAHMIPSAIVRLDTLPLTRSGKLDQRALPAPPRPAADSSTATWLPLERQVAEVWKAVLALDHVGRDENFFDLGGQSLLLARVLTALRAQVTPALAMIDLFHFPTVRALAAHLARLTSSEPPRAAAADRMPLRKRIEQQQRAMKRSAARRAANDREDNR